MITKTNSEDSSIPDQTSENLLITQNSEYSSVLNPTSEIVNIEETSIFESQTPTINNSNETFLLPEVIINIDLNEGINEKELDSILQDEYQKMPGNNETNKIIIYNANKIQFNSNLSTNLFIKPMKPDSEIEYNDGNLSINGEGNLNIIPPKDSQTNTISFNSKSNINGSVTVTVPDSLESILIDSIKLKNNSSIAIEDKNKEIKFNVKNILTSENTNATISNVTIIDILEVVQTATINLDNISLANALINFETIDYSKYDNWIPFVTRSFNNLQEELF